MGKAPVYINIGPVQHRDDGSLYVDVAFNQFDIVRDKLLSMEEEAADAAIRSLGYNKERTCKMVPNGERGYAATLSCSVCGEAQSVYATNVDYFNYCPNCGAKVVE